MIKKIYYSAILNSWFNGGIQLLSSLIAIPIVLVKLSVAEINVWFLFASVTAFGQTMVSGFARTFSRFITYAYSGLKIEDFSSITDKKETVFNESYDSCELSSIFAQMKQINTLTSVLFFLVIGGVGYFFLAYPISEMEDGLIGWLAYIMILFVGGLNLYFGLYTVFLQGIKKVHIIQRTFGVVNLIGLLVILMVLFYYPTFLSIVLVYQFISLSASILIYFNAKKKLRQMNIVTTYQKFDFNLFSIVWDSAWKNGLTSIISGCLKHFSALLIAQWFSPVQSASFLFTKRIFDILEKFTALTFTARLPYIAQLRSRGLYIKLKVFLRQTILISFAIFILGYIIFITMGEFILGFIESNVNLGTPALIILFSISTFLSRWSAIMVSVSNQSNKIIEHKNAVIIFFVFSISIILMYNSLLLLAFPMANILALITAMPLIIYQVYKTIDTSFYRFERFVFLPSFALLLLINLIYFIS